MGVLLESDLWETQNPVKTGKWNAKLYFAVMRSPHVKVSLSFKFHAGIKLEQTDLMILMSI